MSAADRNRGPGTVQRTKGIGGSDVAALCGLSHRKTAYQLYLEKRGVIPPWDGDSTRLRFGRRLEQPLADEFAFVTGRKVWKQKRTLRHALHRFLLANIDRWQLRGEQKGVWEGKTADHSQRRIWMQGGVPLDYYFQGQHYLLVTGLELLSFGVLFGLSDYVWFDVERDEAVIQRLLELELDFWRRVKLGEPPDYQFGQAGANLVQRMFAKAEPGKHVVLPQEAEAKVRRLLSLQKAVKGREEEIEDLKTWLKLQMGDGEHALIHGVAKIRWANQDRTTVNSKKLAQAHPTIAAEFTETTQGRRFTVSALAEVEEDTTPDDPIIVTTGVRQIQMD